MKKINLTLIIAIITILSVNAQTTFGVKAGVNFASFSYTADYIPFEEAEKGRTSLHFGVVAEIQISDKFSFQPELLFSPQGTSYDNLDWDGGHIQESALKLSYLTMPLMAKYYVAEGFSLEAGPQIGYLLSARDAYVDLTYGDNYADDWYEDTKKVDHGLNFGIGYKLDFGLNFGARYYLGLSHVFYAGDEDENYAIYNNVFQFSVGYFF
jgi:hypothetical protein